LVLLLIAKVRNWVLLGKRDELQTQKQLTPRRRRGAGGIAPQRQRIMLRRYGIILLPYGRWTISEVAKLMKSPREATSKRVCPFKSLF